MALIHGVHILAHGERTEARRIAVDIQTYQRLLVGRNSMYGAGAYAWYQYRVPLHLHPLPQVLFLVDDTKIEPVCKRDGTPLGFFRIPGPMDSYVDIMVVSFTNVW
jgi:hypothetical protein